MKPSDSTDVSPSGVERVALKPLTATLSNRALGIARAAPESEAPPKPTDISLRAAISVRWPILVEDAEACPSRSREYSIHREEARGAAPKLKRYSGA